MMEEVSRGLGNGVAARGWCSSAVADSLEVLVSIVKAGLDTSFNES